MREEKKTFPSKLCFSIKTVFTNCSLRDQIYKVAEEVNEAISEANKPKEEASFYGLDMEVADIMFACSAYFAKRGYSQDKIDLLVKSVEFKNLDRGYYDTGD